MNETLLELYEKSLEKWKKLLKIAEINIDSYLFRYHVFTPCSFCEDRTIRMCVDEGCDTCRINHSICDYNGRRGLISHLRPDVSKDNRIRIVNEIITALTKEIEKLKQSVYIAEYFHYDEYWRVGVFKTEKLAFLGILQYWRKKKESYRELKNTMNDWLFRESIKELRHYCITKEKMNDVEESEYDKMYITMTLGEIRDGCNDWKKFCDWFGWREHYLNEGGNEDTIQVLTLDEARELGFTLKIIREKWK